jgi:hypothetical protein
VFESGKVSGVIIDMEDDETECPNAREKIDEAR